MRVRVTTVLLITASALLAFASVVHAEEHLTLYQSKEGAELAPLGMNVSETIRINESKCVFTMPEGNLHENNKPTLTVTFPTFEEKECEGGSSKTRFIRTIIGPFSEVSLTSEAAKAEAKIRVGTCLYNIAELNGSLSLSTELKGITVSGTGILKEGEGSCTSPRPFTGVVRMFDPKFEEGLQALYLT